MGWTEDDAVVFGSLWDSKASNSENNSARHTADTPTASLHSTADASSSSSDSHESGSTAAGQRLDIESSNIIEGKGTQHESRPPVILVANKLDLADNDTAGRQSLPQQVSLTEIKLLLRHKA